MFETQENQGEKLYLELVDYETAGVIMLMDGFRVSPMQITRACMAKDVGTYMRDYTINEEGNIESLSFHYVK